MYVLLDRARAAVLCAAEAGLTLATIPGLTFYIIAYALEGHNDRRLCSKSVTVDPNL